MEIMKSDNIELPLVSFVLPVFNRVKTFEAALLSIARERDENYPNLEIVVIDGGSTDGTADLIQKHAGMIDYWVSERDVGVADAFNKGVKAARGEIVRYVASDDTLIPDFTRKMVEYLLAHPDIDVLGARSRVLRRDAAGNESEDFTFTRLQSGPMNRREVLTWDRRGVFAYIETWFLRRRVFERAGCLDTKLRIATDVEYAFRLVAAGCRIYVLPDVIVNKVFYADGSNNVSNVARSIAEHRQVIRRHGRWDERLWFMWTYPQPLPVRLSWGAWLKAVKAWQSLSPGTYRRISAAIKPRP